MNLVINFQYKYISDFIEKIPTIFPYEGESIHKLRNEIKIFKVENLTINVKSYKKPIFLNRIAYTFFRESKARRAYNYALKLIDLGVNTAAPIAYVECKKGGLLSSSYFVSLQVDTQGNLKDITNPQMSRQEKHNIAVALAKFTASIHKKGVLHIDYSPGNILYRKENEKYEFILIDINRMKFTDIDKDKGCNNFCRLWGDDDFFIVLAQTYAQEMGYSQEECINKVLEYRKIEWKKRNKKREIKNFFKEISKKLFTKS